jgi:hypothetical protein
MLVSVIVVWKVTLLVANTAWFAALRFCTVGTSNSAFGQNAMNLTTLGVDNTAHGAHALESLTTGTGNTAIGLSALDSVVTGTNNTALGYFAGNVHSLADSDNIDIGHPGIAGESARIRIGTAGTQTHNFQAGIFGQTGNGTGIAVLVDNAGQLCTVASDRELKENISPLEDVRNIIRNLKPSRFSLKKHKSPVATEVGLIAQEVEEIAPELVLEFTAGECAGYKTVRYDRIPILLLKEAQRIQDLTEKLEMTISRILEKYPL